MKPPEYRVRLFLSVDLTGSTAFKHNTANTLIWIKAFKSFYQQFPSMLIKNYRNIATPDRHISADENKDGHPKLWKTVGDEILFCCTLTSLCQLGACIDAFVETLVEYGSIAKQNGLNTKGNGWVASFPTPNCSIQPIKSPSLQDGDEPMASHYKSLPTEEDEASVDLDPSLYDFLGKGIDAGFRISRNSGIDTLTISPGLGILLCECLESKSISRFNTSLRLVGMQEFKGVAKNNHYPVLTIDTYRDQKYKSLLSKQRELLGENVNQKREKLEEYLRDYLEYFKIEIPSVKIMAADPVFDPPSFYHAYVQQWHAELLKEKSEDAKLQESANASEEGTKNSSGDKQLRVLAQKFKKIKIDFDHN